MALWQSMLIVDRFLSKIFCLGIYDLDTQGQCFWLNHTININKIISQKEIGFAYCRVKDVTIKMLLL
jgi:hypothetical protein